MKCKICDQEDHLYHCRDCKVLICEFCGEEQLGGFVCDMCLPESDNGIMGEDLCNCCAELLQEDLYFSCSMCHHNVCNACSIDISGLNICEECMDEDSVWNAKASNTDPKYS